MKQTIKRGIVKETRNLIKGAKVKFVVLPENPSGYVQILESNGIKFGCCFWELESNIQVIESK